ncbi:MAG: hypothetical protein ACKO37_01125 [Vampirovibrionales bacterium]
MTSVSQENLSMFGLGSSPVERLEQTQLNASGVLSPQASHGEAPQGTTELFDVLDEVNAERATSDAMMPERLVPTQTDTEQFAWLTSINDIQVEQAVEKLQSVQEAETFYKTQYSHYKLYEPILQGILSEKIIHYANQAMDKTPIPSTKAILTEAIQELERKHIPKHLHVQHFPVEPRHVGSGTSRTGPMTKDATPYGKDGSWFGIPKGTDIDSLSPAEFQALSQRVTRFYYH